MSTTITCPHCQKQVEITQALRHQLQEQILTAERQKFKTLLDTERQKSQQLIEQEQKKFQNLLQQKQQELEKNLAQKTQEIQEQASKRLKDQFELTLKNSQQEAEEYRNRTQQLQQQLLETNKLIRELKIKDEERQLELERKLAQEQEKISQQVRQTAFEEFHLKLKEKDKQLDDVRKANEDLKRRLEQGSQQIQGEVLELELEQLLVTEFSGDTIKEVPKGIRGADVIQEVCDRSGRKCGTILWESKNTKAFSPSWISKLKEDQRTLKAEIAVLVTTTMPDDIQRFALREGVWISDRDSLLGLAHALRLNIVQVHQAHAVSIGKHEKMELLYQYLAGNEFKHRVEGIVENFTLMQQELEKEKRFFSLKWARQEKQIRGVIDQTHGMYGDLQGIIGAALPQISSLQLEDSESVEDIHVEIHAESVTEENINGESPSVTLQASLLEE